MTQIVPLKGRVKRRLGRWLRETRTRCFGRRIHVYCLGLPRSGTHSMAALFKRKFWAEHEPNWEAWLDLHLNNFRQNQEKAFAQSEIERGIRNEHYEMQASHWLNLAAPILARLHPHAKFIILLREPIDWVNSMLNDLVQLPAVVGDNAPKLRAYYDLRFHGEPTAREEFTEPSPWPDGFPPLAGMLAYWSSTYTELCAAIPAERRLILRTADISECAPVLARFLNVKEGVLDQTRAQVDRRTDYPKIVEQMDQSDVDRLVAHHLARVPACIREKLNGN